MSASGYVWLEGVHWGLLTAIYLFFATLGGGAYLAGVAAYALGRDDRRSEPMALTRWAFLTAFVATGIAGIAILAHLARPLSGVLFPLTLTEFGSWITRGTWILVTLAVFAALQTLWVHFGTVGREAEGPSAFVRGIAGMLRLDDALDRLADAIRPGGIGYWIVAVLGLVPALGTVYTGFELAVVETVPLWNHPTLLPALFVVSGVASGFALALALTVAFDGATDRLVVGFAGAVSLGLLLTGGLLWALLNALGNGPAATESMAMVDGGSLSVFVTLLAAGIAVSVVASPILAWLWYAREETAVSRWVVRPGLVASLLFGVVAIFLIRYVLLIGAVQSPTVVF
ncbi:MAG: NrfD/PsrC family molybdoenzyme membrane anchor subunit [Halobacteriales archaeon]